MFMKLSPHLQQLSQQIIALIPQPEQTSQSSALSVE